MEEGEPLPRLPRDDSVERGTRPHIRSRIREAAPVDPRRDAPRPLRARSRVKGVGGGARRHRPRRLHRARRLRPEELGRGARGTHHAPPRAPAHRQEHQALPGGGRLPLPEAQPACRVARRPARGYVVLRQGRRLHLERVLLDRGGDAPRQEELHRIHEGGLPAKDLVLALLVLQEPEATTRQAEFSQGRPFRNGGPRLGDPRRPRARPRPG